MGTGTPEKEGEGVQVYKVRSGGEKRGPQGYYHPHFVK